MQAVGLVKGVSAEQNDYDLAALPSAVAEPRVHENRELSKVGVVSRSGQPIAV